MKMEKAGPNYRRIKTDTGTIVGFASRLTNDKWVAIDYDGVRIEEAGIFDTAAQVTKYFKGKV